MANKIIGGVSVPNMPWEDRPAGAWEPLWRFSGNPILSKKDMPGSHGIYNSAAIPFEGGFAGVFRIDDESGLMKLHVGFSADGLKWDIDPKRIQFQSDNEEINTFEFGYDPRVCFIEDRYYVTWCNGYADCPTIGVAYTYDFKTFYQLENAFLPFNRNGVLFPRKIGGNYAMLSRPSDNGHTPFGDMFYSESPDMEFWGRHRLVMKTAGGWQSTKIGAGPVPVETEEGWLLIYHGVSTSCNGFVYSMGAALLDRDKPWKVLARTAPRIFCPEELYEQVGEVQNVTFPCAMLADKDTGRIAVYYGGADSVTGIAFTTVDILTDFVKNNSMV